MSMVSTDQAKAQTRFLLSAEDDLIQGYLDAAEYAAQVFLGRNVYPDSDTMLAAQAALTDGTAQAAQDAYNAAYATLGFDPRWPPCNPTFVQTTAMQVADEAYTQAQAAMTRLAFAMVITPAFVQAILMTVAHWFVNREAVIVDPAKPAELPMGARSLLEIDRRQMGA